MRMLYLEEEESEVQNIFRSEGQPFLLIEQGGNIPDFWSNKHPALATSSTIFPQFNTTQ